MRTDDIRPGAYLVDEDSEQLLYVLALRVAERDNGAKVRVAIMEDAMTGDVEPWDFPDAIVMLRLVRSAS